ncbi:MAG TPA: MFS transporter [Vicinamibacterales bacterium]|jgi:DHA2 family multidrug resistance protein-like MFS transporter|nr:MFS transporter [Vicinamibacterales bacterium]
MTPQQDSYRGNDKLLFGIILGVLAFWLFAQTTLNIAPAMAAELGVAASVMNIAVSITALFSGIFIVVVGGLADRVGRVKILMWGFILGIAGGLLVGAAPSGTMAVPLLMAGRVCQGLSAAFVMPSSLALIKTYWDGAGRQRAVSLWSMGSWGGSGFAALFGGLMTENVGWRWIFFASAAVSAGGMLMVRGTPESKAATAGDYRFDPIGVLTFMVAMLALQVLATQGSDIGWTSPIALALGAIAVVVGAIFFRVETRTPNPFVNFALFRNSTFTGATVSNFMLNGVAGMLLVSMMLLQLGGGLTAQAAGMLTIGYAVAIVAFIRVGEKLLQKFGARKPMIWGSLIVGLSIAMLMPTNLLLGQYTILAVASYTLFGLGLAFYATPSTDAALSNLPDDQAGSGSGLYKMASSLGASFGVAISAAIFTALSGDRQSTRWLDGVVTFAGRQDNLAVRQAALVALAFNLLMVAAAIVSIVLTVPRAAAASDRTR